MPCLGPVFIIYTEQTNSCILKVHYNTYQTQRVHTICQFFLSEWESEWVSEWVSQSVSAGFTYRLDRLKPRASQFRWPPTKVYNIFNTVIGLSHVCCHNVLYILNNPSVIFLAHFISALHFRIVQNFKHTSICLQSWRWGIGRGLTRGIA